MDASALGRLLHSLAIAQRARRVLLLGTSTGGGAIALALARAVGPAGRVIAVEPDRAVSGVARDLLEAADASAWVDIFCGPLADVTGRMLAASVPEFDLVVVDLAPEQRIPAVALVDALRADYAPMVVLDEAGFRVDLSRPGR